MRFAKLLVVLLAAASGLAQPRFDVASVKAVEQQEVLTLWPKRSPGRFTWTAPMIFFIRYAYETETSFIDGEFPDGTYRIEATMPTSASEQDVRLMLRSLLSERFHMAVHSESRQEELYVLSIAKGGVKLTDYPAGTTPPHVAEILPEGRIISHFPRAGILRMEARGVSMSQIVGELKRVLRANVRDETGLAGRYYFMMDFAAPDNPDVVEAQTIFSAVQRDLGLKLDSRKGPVQHLVIDRMSATPTDN